MILKPRRRRPKPLQLANLQAEHFTVHKGRARRASRIESGGATGLHLLCRQYAQSADIYSSGARGRKIKAFLTFLLERGMNPSIPLGHETAIDILLDSWRFASGRHATTAIKNKDMDFGLFETDRSAPTLAAHLFLCEYSVL